MKILVLNGSPTGEKGMTWYVANRMIAGMQKAGAEVTTIHLAHKKIHHCTGELACWFKTPGKCIHRDDMDEILHGYDGIETLVLATPVYVDGMTGLLKNCLDRMVPVADPHIEIRDGHCRHTERSTVTKIKRVALVSVCGFFESENFDPLIHHVQAICRNIDAVYAGALIRPAAGMLPHVGLLHPFKTHAVHKAIEHAGEELVRGGSITAATANEAATEIISRETYLKYANRYFDQELQKIEERTHRD